MTIRTFVQVSQKNKNAWVFAIFWMIAFILYFPTAKAGWVRDAIGWINDLKHHNFLDFINRTDSGSESFYQLFATHYYICYKLWGMNMWMWSLFYMTAHVINATLLFIVFRNIFKDSGIQKSGPVAFCGALLYVVCPHISEVLVWKACFHYIMGVSFILVSLLMMQRYQHRQRNIYVVVALLIFCLSAFGLEIFYLTPFLGLFLALYYRVVLNYEKRIFRKTICCFFIPQIILFCLYFAGLYATYKFIGPHGSNLPFQASSFLSKPLKLVFHILFLGRYFPSEIRKQVYQFCNATVTITVFYALCSFALLYLAFRFKRLTAAGKTLVFLFVWVMFSIVIMLPASVPEDSIVSCDRYTYVPCAFSYMFLALFVYNAFGKKIFISFMLVYTAINVFFTLKVNKYWQQSARVVNSLLYTFPNDPSKTVLLLDRPSCMKGVEMIVALDNGGFRTMYNVMMPYKISNPVYDVEAYYSQSPTDGAHVNVINDSAILVTLNQWGTWWLYFGYGATSYENKDYKVNMIDAGHKYELTLKHPVNQYLLLYQAGGEWKVADWSKKNVDQF